jgi:hypothetical protein
MKRALAIVAFLATASAAVAVFAGSKDYDPVVIDEAGRKAYGSLGSTRNASPSGAYIGCQINAAADGSPVRFVCSARVPGPPFIFKYCSGSNPAMVAAAAAVTTDSRIYFSWDASGACTYLTVSNRSTEEPKAP